MTLASAYAKSYNYPDPELQKMWQRKGDLKDPANPGPKPAENVGKKQLYVSSGDSLGKSHPGPLPAEQVKKSHHGKGVGPLRIADRDIKQHGDPMPPLPVSSPAATAADGNEFMLKWHGDPLPAATAATAPVAAASGDKFKLVVNGDPLPAQPVTAAATAAAASGKYPLDVPKPADQLTAAQLMLGKFQPANLDIVKILGDQVDVAA